MSDVPVSTKGPGEVFCSSCGGIIRREAEICPHCGVRQFIPPHIAVPQTNRRGGFGVASMVIGIVNVPFCFTLGSFLGIIGLVFGIIGATGSKKGMAIAGIILNTISFIIGLIIVFAVIAAIVGTGAGFISDFLQDYL